MRGLDEKDFELIAAARDAITRNYDEANEMHTVGAALRCADGEIFVGVNVFSIHSACAEQVALGAAITAGKRKFDSVVAVRGKSGEEIIPPCGNCRQIMSEYEPDIEVIMSEECKMTARELLPLAYVAK